MADLDLDALAAKLSALTKRAKSEPGDDDDEQNSGKVPYARFAEVNARLKALRAEHKELADSIESLKAAHTAELGRVREAAAKDVQRVATDAAESLALVEGGIKDPLGRAAVRQAWEYAPKETRGESPAKWWAGLTAAHTAAVNDPKNKAPDVPPTLRGYLPAVETAAAPPGSPRTGQRSQPPPGAPSQRQGAATPAADPAQGIDAWLTQLQQSDATGA